MRRFLSALVLCGSTLGCATQSGLSEPQVSLPEGAKLLPARARRLTNFELDNSLSRLTGLEVALGPQLPRDVRQEGYTPNANQDVSSAWAARYSALVGELSTRAASKLGQASTCHDLSPACRKLQVQQLGRLAFRRSLSAEERG